VFPARDVTETFRQRKPELTLRTGGKMVCFQTKNTNFGKICLEGLVIFYDHLKYFTTIWYNVLPFGIVCGYLLYFLRFGMLRPRKIWQPC
jgi:hypothetical protein